MDLFTYLLIVWAAGMTGLYALDRSALMPWPRLTLQGVVLGLVIQAVVYLHRVS